MLTGLPAEEIQRLAQLYGQIKPGLIKIADGINRNLNGGQAVRAICALPALTGQYGREGAGLAYSNSGYLAWDDEAVNKRSQCPAAGRWVNMNRLGAALTGEIQDPPIKSLFVFAANPAASSPNSGRIIEGLRREDLFTVVHELFMTDTADYADIVLPATSQLEQTDLHKAYGHTYLSYNHQAVQPLGKSKSNWELMTLLAQKMGFEEPWLRQDAVEVIEEVLSATAVHTKALNGITISKLQNEKAIPLNIQPAVPFSDGYFPTPSGKVELYSATMANETLDPLPGFNNEAKDDGSLDQLNDPLDPATSLNLISGAAHHFVSSSLANQPGLISREGQPFFEIHPDDAVVRGIDSGDEVIVENGRGWVQLKAFVTDAIRPGVIASPKGRWQKLSEGRNMNWTTPDTLADMAGQSTFHSNRVWLRRVGDKVVSS
jgi:anaerobic selenocysteine-containing dehydrogenase